MITEEERAYQIVNCLCDEGWEAYLAGGAARDILDGDTPGDYDIVTAAPYAIVRQIFQDRPLKIVGEKFKVCVVDGVEIATYRSDEYFGLSAQNCLVKDAETIEEDLARRDLTINSLAFCPYTGDIIDAFGGRRDLENRVIRFTGDPRVRIYEDPCRILRACRFLAKIEGRFDSETLRALRHHAGLVRGHVAPDRIRREVLKAMACRRPSLFFDALYDIGVLGYISPGLEACYGYDGGPHHAETLDAHFKLVGDALPARAPLLRLAGYLHDVGKPAVGQVVNGCLCFHGHDKAGAEIAAIELERLHFSRKEINYIRALVDLHMRVIEPDSSAKAVRKALRAMEHRGVAWKDWLRLNMADRAGNLKRGGYDRHAVRKIVRKIRAELRPETGAAVFNRKDLAIDGRYLVDHLGMQSGPVVGRILGELLEYVLDDPGLNSRETLARIARQIHLNHENGDWKN